MGAISTAGVMSDQPQSEPRRRGCLFYLVRGVTAVIVLFVLVALLGLAFQALAVESDKRSYPPPGQLYAVNGHQMHILCQGEGSPTVVLQAGGAADSTWWYWVQNQVSASNRVCAFDRPGMGWSEPAPEPRDADTLTEELHTLLQEAGESAPYIMAGHSWGAVLTRIYAARYPGEVGGIVLVDSAILIPKHFADKGEFEAWQAGFGALKPVYSLLTRLGVPRLTDVGMFESAGYPHDVAVELVALHSRSVVIDTDFKEFNTQMWALTEASAEAENLGDLPMVVLWAPLSWVSSDRQLPQAPAVRAEVSTYSLNAVTRSVDGADHVSILGHEAYARQVSDAVLEVMGAAQSGARLAQ